MNEIDITKSRFRDASWFENLEKFETPIVIGGAGGIGSWLTFFLGRMMGPRSLIFLYDFDTVEEVNIAGQFFKIGNIGQPKVTAIRDIVEDFSDYTKISGQPEKYTLESLKSPIMFSAFDNMEARKVMFTNWKSEAAGHGDEGSIFIDGRLLAEQLQVLFVTPKNAERYEKDYLFDDSEVEDVNCSYKQTTHFAATIAAKMVQGFTNWLAKDHAEVPFYYEEIGSLFYSNTED